MISRKHIGLIALVTPLWFLTVYLIMSSRRPEYSHLTKAISELGSLDAPNRWVWNILGYILPGLAIALLGVGLKREFAPERRALISGYSIIATGLFMAMSGVFPGDFENRSSTTMILHTVGSLGSFVAFLIAGFALPRSLRRREGFRSLALPSLVLVWGAILTGFLRSGEAPGLGQRLGFAFVLLWVGLLGYGLVRYSRSALDHPDSEH